MQSKKLSSATSVDIKFGSSVRCPDYTMLPTSLTVKTSFGKKKQFGESVNSNFLDGKEKEEFLLLLNVSFSIFKLEFLKLYQQCPVETWQVISNPSKSPPCTT